MEDRTLLKLSFILSVTGVILLSIGVSLREPQQIFISSINRDLIGEFVSVTVKVESVRFDGKHLFMTVTDGTGSIKTVFFESDMKRTGFYGTDIREGSLIVVEGKVERYKGQLELLARSVTFV